MKPNEFASVTINGEQKDLPLDCSVLEMLKFLELGHRGLAVEIEGELISHERFSDFRIANGQKIEIVTFVGGG